jgi:ankyrin repeat protein
MATINKELKDLFAKINSTADFGYVEFSDINATNALGENALHITVRWGDIDAVKLLITAGVETLTNTVNTATPLFIMQPKRAPKR